jgi:hypothetical protein
LGLLGGVASGIAAVGITDMRFEDISTPFSVCRDVIRLRDNCFLFVMQRLAVLGSRFGVFAGGACGVSAIRDSNITAGAYGVALVGSSSCALDNVYITGCTAFSVFMFGGGGSMSYLNSNALVCTDEGQSIQPEAAVCVVSVRTVNLVGGVLEKAFFDVPLLMVDSVDRVSAQSALLHAKAAGTANLVQDITAGGMTVGSVRFSGCKEVNAGHPRSNTANLVKFDLEA